MSVIHGGLTGNINDCQGTDTIAADRSSVRLDCVLLLVVLWYVAVVMFRDNDGFLVAYDVLIEVNAKVKRPWGQI